MDYLPNSDVEKDRPFWKTFAEKNRGTYQIRYVSSYTLAIISAHIPHRGFTIVFEHSDTRPCKIHCDVDLKPGGRFSIWPEDFAEKLACFLGAQDIQTGHPTLDKAFIFKGETASKIQNLLFNEQLQAFLLKHPFANIRIIERDGHDRIEFLYAAQISNSRQLDSALIFFQRLLDDLVRLDMVESRDGKSSSTQRPPDHP